MPRISISEISPEFFKKLPRSTQWRSKKRGWVFIDYHQPRVSERNDRWFLSNFPRLNKIAKHRAYLLSDAISHHPYIDRDDVIQEILLYLLNRAQRLKDARKPFSLAYIMAKECALKCLGIYGFQKFSLKRSARMETKLNSVSERIL